MPWGLSDEQRRRLERERERAERKLEKERRRIAPILAHEREQLAREDVHRARFGPRTVTGPDDEPVLLEVRATGHLRFRDPPPSQSGLFGLDPKLRGASLGLAAVLWQAVTPDGFLLRIYAAGLERRYCSVRMRDEHTAARIFAEVAAVVEAGGLDGLRRWTDRT